jgi:hypothetical protein
MSIYDKASLVHIPSGVNSGTLYNVLPNTTDGDFDFTRGSTATRVNKDGLIETVASGVPRLDYPLLDGVVQDCPTLFLEPIRINIYTQSEDLSQATTLTNTTVDADSITSPDGALTGNKITQTSGAYLRKTLTSLSGTYAWSFFAKKGDLRYLCARTLFVQNGTTPSYSNNIIDLDTKTIAYKGTSVTSASIQQYPNDWIKVEIIATDNATGSADLLDFFFTDNASSTATGAVGNGYLWGVQFESGSYGTSYIPNLTTGSTSRSADAATGAGTSDTFNDSEGVLMAEFSVFDVAANSKSISIYKTSSPTSNAVILYYNANRIAFDILNPSGTVSVLTDISVAKELNKVAIKYKSGDIALWFNGLELVTRTNTLSLSGLDKLEFDFVSNNDFYGKIKDIRYYNTALSDSELRALTT